MEQRKPVADQIFGDNKAPVDVVLNADFAKLKEEVELMEARGKAMPKQITTEEQASKAVDYIADARRLTNKVENVRSTEGKPMLDAKRAVDGFFKALGGSLLDGPIADNDNAVRAFMREQAAKKAAEQRRIQQEADEKARLAREREANAKTPQAAANHAARAEQYEAQADTSAIATATASEAKAKITGTSGSLSSKKVWKFVITDYQACIAPLGALGGFLESAAIEKALGVMVKAQKNNAKWPGVRFYEDIATAVRRRG
ncbi:hypothetical protein [Marivivens aquimaris]|uniref:hypothetical protein n=1 Tax=Marivivens aquimaris TaxID=2774876 RepID=UPI001880FC7A|nr:hypothetical protein [Marivivens aquimaris]